MAGEIRSLQHRLQDLLFRIAPPDTTVHSGRGGLFIPVMSKQAWLTIQQDDTNLWTLSRFRTGYAPRIEVVNCEGDILIWVQTRFMEKRK
jgi:hypothetical protein